MSTLNLELNIIENATFFYVKVKNPSLKYQSQVDREYAVDAHVDKATAKAWNKAFPKQKAKEMDYNEFVEKHGAENAIGEEEQFIIKLKKDAQYKDKETGETKKIADKYRPRAFEVSEDGTLTDITFTKLIGGGSKGAVLFEVTTNSFGTFAKLVGLRVDQLVEVQGDGGDKFGALGKVNTLAEAPTTQDAPVAENQGEASPAKQAEDDQWK